MDESAEKMLDSEQVVKDVCARCNNGVLGDLDAYAKQFFKSNDLLTTNFTRNQLRLRYEYDKILRWNLKASYNSARRFPQRSEILSPFVDYIISGENRPPPERVTLVGHLPRSHKFKGNERKKLQKENLVDRSGRSSPFLVRLSWGEDPHNMFQGAIVRRATWGALCLTMLIFEAELTESQAAQIRARYLKEIPRSVVLSPDNSCVDLKRAKLSWFDEYEPQIAKQINIDGVQSVFK